MWCSLAAHASCLSSCATGTFCPGPCTPWHPGTLRWPRLWAFVANTAAAAANAPVAADRKTRRKRWGGTAQRVWRCMIIQPCHKMSKERRLFMQHSSNILELNLYLPVWVIRNATLDLGHTFSSLLSLWYDYYSPLLDDILSTAIKPVTITIMLGNMNRSIGHAVNLLLDMWCIFNDVQIHYLLWHNYGWFWLYFCIFYDMFQRLWVLFSTLNLKLQMFNVAFKIFVVLQYLRSFNICK